MSSDANTSYGDSYSLSLRLSCDRCRVQKLKCSVPTGCSACERCTRAKVACVFGRRIRSKRRSSDANNGRRMRVEHPSTVHPTPSASVPPVQSNTDTFTSVVPATTPASCPVTAGEISTSTYPNQIPDLSTETSKTHSDASPPGAVELNSGSYKSQPACNEFALGLHTDTNNVVNSNNEMAHCGWLQSGTDPAMDMYELGPIDIAPWPQLANMTASASCFIDDVTTCNGSEDSINSSSPVLTSQRLTTLLSNMQQQLAELEQGPWHTDSAASLDDYPIGTVFELSQQFGAIAGFALSNTGSVSGGPEEGGIQDAGMPTMVLVMCGYMWLKRIYIVVLDHFQKHLNQVSMSHHPGAIINAHKPHDSIGDAIAGRSETASALRLGELSCADTVLNLQQIHTAIRMLLDALYRLEGYLGPEAGIARDMAVAMLLNSRRRQDGGYGGLGKKVTAVKELLREKMGL